VVGVTTLVLGSAGPKYGERLATVFYPSSLSAAGARGRARFSYTQTDVLPASFRGIVPPKYDTTTTVDAYRNAPGSTAGPYPVVLFSHGYGGERLEYSTLLAGIASWGYVVVSADYLERGLAAQILGVKNAPPPAFDNAIMMSSLRAVEAASARPSSVLHGTVDAALVAAVGHSAGGQTAFDALRSPRVAAAVGWAPEGPAGPHADKPIMIIHAAGDDAIPTAQVRREYAAFGGSKALVQISGEGHNTYTDVCSIIRAGGGLIGYAVAKHIISGQLAQLAINGCQAKDLPPQRFWPIVQYYTVFQLQAQLRHRASTVPVPAPATFPGYTVTVTQHH
jgi:dienelactone hydrolase